MAPRFLIDENLTPLLADHLRSAHGFDAVHVREIGPRGASDAVVFSRAVAEDRIVITSNGEDFRKLGARDPRHPGIAIVLDAVGRGRQVVLGVELANVIEKSATTRGHIFAIDRYGVTRRSALR